MNSCALSDNSSYCRFPPRECRQGTRHHRCTAIYTTAAGQTPPLQMINQNSFTFNGPTNQLITISHDYKKLFLINVKHLGLIQLAKTELR